MTMTKEALLGCPEKKDFSKKKEDVHHFSSGSTMVLLLFHIVKTEFFNITAVAVNTLYLVKGKDVAMKNGDSINSCKWSQFVKCARIHNLNDYEKEKTKDQDC